MKFCGTEVFSNLSLKRNFKNIPIIFNKNELSVNIQFNSKDIELFKNIIYCYGFMDDISDYGIDYDLFINNNKISKNNFNINDINFNDIIKISYKDSGCFELYSHILIHEIDDFHDDNYFLRKELEKWSI